jgi:hypothetical protein
MPSIGALATRAFSFFALNEGEFMSSKLWIKVQRPYMGRVKMEGYQPKYEDVRDVTAIVVAEQKQEHFTVWSRVAA